MEENGFVAEFHQWLRHAESEGPQSSAVAPDENQSFHCGSTEEKSDVAGKGQDAQEHQVWPAYTFTWMEKEESEEETNPHILERTDSGNIAQEISFILQGVIIMP